MSRSISNLDCGQAQDVGLSGQSVQEDGVFTGLLCTASGLELMIGVVVDGESSYGYGERAAELVISQFVRNIKAAEGNDIRLILSDVLSNVRSSFCREIEIDGRLDLMDASVTAVAILHNRLFLVHVGNTRAFLIRGGQVIHLTQEDLSNTPSSSDAQQVIGLAASLNPDMCSAPRRNVPLISEGDVVDLRDGDHIVLCSDGLIKERPDKHGYLLNPDVEMPPVLGRHNTSALQAARTLVALSVGRNADDNVSAVVINVPKSFRLGRIALWGPIITAIALIAAVLSFWPRSPGLGLEPTITSNPTSFPMSLFPTPSVTPVTQAIDEGYASVRPPRGLVELSRDGEGWEMLLPGNSVGAGDSVRTGVDGEANLLLSDGSQIYLNPNSQLGFDQIDSPAALDQTILTLSYGDLLLTQQASGDTVTVKTPGQGAAALEMVGTMVVTYDPDGGKLLVECLSGQCVLGDSLSPGTRASWSEGQRQAEPARPIPPERYEAYAHWNSLCQCIPESLLPQGTDTP